MTQEDMDKIVQLIEQRKVDVLAANNVPEGDIQHAWISGIYSDITEYLKVQFN
jgi:hypothetical protein